MNRNAPDEAARILLAAAEAADRDGLTERYEIHHAIRMAAERVMELGPVYASIWFERSLGRLHRYGERPRQRTRTTADWVSRLLGAAKLEPLENPRWPPLYGW